MDLVITNRMQALEKLSTAELRQRMAEKLTVTAEALWELAAIVRVLEEERHEDLSSLRIGIMPMLRKIAYGQLMPELVAQFAGNGLLLKHAGNLPIPEQRRLVAGEKMRITLPDGDHLLVEPHRMTSKQIRQVFAHDHIRDDGEQRGYVEDRRRPVIVAETNDVRIDAKSGSVIINGKRFTRSELASLLARLG